MALGSMQATSSGHAQMYKWVDASGQVHYSDRPEQAGKARVEQVKVPVPAAAPVFQGIPEWRKREAEYRWRQARAPRQPSGNTSTQRDKGYYGNDVDSDTNRCRLARDILSGAARHSNGKTTDQYDRDVAQNDVGSFCR